MFQPGRDDDLAFRFGQDGGSPRWRFFALFGLWARLIAGPFMSHASATASRTHANTLAFGKTARGLVRTDAWRSARRAERPRVARSRVSMTCPCFAPTACFSRVGRATAAGTADALEDMRRAVELLREQNVLLFDGLLKIAHAEDEAQAGDPGRAIAILDEALAMCDPHGYRALEAELHRTRGEILLKRDPANPAPAEDAFRTAIAVAKRQGTRSFELRAALALAKLYRADRLCRGGPCRAGAGHRRFLAYARNARDRRGAGAVRDSGVGRRLRVRSLR